MIEVKLHGLHPQSGQTVTIFDYLVASAQATWKLSQFCTSAGLTAQYEAGELSAIDVEGVEVQADVVVEEDPQFGTKNKIAKYLGSPYSRDAVPF